MNTSKNIENVLSKLEEKKIIPPPKHEYKREKPRQNYVPRGDYGDDIRDYEKKDLDAWNKEVQSNPMQRR